MQEATVADPPTKDSTQPNLPDRTNPSQSPTKAPTAASSPLSSLAPSSANPAAATSA
ncbi:MAG: hypothetical protein Q9183_005944, partial [Haloplaca sp. 2 TL-2023]